MYTDIYYFSPFFSSPAISSLKNRIIVPYLLNHTVKYFLLKSFGGLLIQYTRFYLVTNNGNW